MRSPSTTGEQPLLTATNRETCAAAKTQHSQTLKKKKKKAPPPQEMVRWSEVRKPLVWTICDARPGRSSKIDQRDEFSEAKLLEGKTNKDRVGWGRRKRGWKHEKWDENTAYRRSELKWGPIQELRGAWPGHSEVVGEGNGELPRQEGVGFVCCRETQEPSLKPSRNRYVRSLSQPDTKLNRIMLLGLQVSREQMLS